MEMKALTKADMKAISFVDRNKCSPYELDSKSTGKMLAEIALS